MLAEEFSADAMAISRATTSTAAQVARELGICHLFCDPGETQRDRLGIRKNDPHGNRMRERIWCNGIARWRVRTVLFLCGDEHLVTFPALLRRRGFAARVLSEGWGAHLNGSRAGIHSGVVKYTGTHVKRARPRKEKAPRP